MIRKTVCMSLAIIACVSLAGGCRQEATSSTPTSTQQTAPRMELQNADETAQTDVIQVTSATFRDVVLRSDRPVLVDFWADWCGPCHALAPTIERLADQFGETAIVAKLNTEEHPKIAQQYDISTLPTIAIFVGGKEVERLQGVASYDTLESKLARWAEDDVTRIGNRSLSRIR